MNARHLLAVSAMTLLLMPFALSAQAHDASVANHELHLFAAADFGINPENVTFSRDIAPILQRSCENCHRAGGGAPMALTTYQEVRRWSQRIKLRTAIPGPDGGHAAVLRREGDRDPPIQGRPVPQRRRVGPDPGLGGQRGPRGESRRPAGSDRVQCRRGVDDRGAGPGAPGPST